MMKAFKKIFALVLALVMAFGMGTKVFAADEEHTITITNTDQYVPHTYEGYQVFKGDLSSDGTTLSNVVWGNGVNGDALLTALKTSTLDAFKGDDPLTEAVETDAYIFASCASPKDVAFALGKNNTIAAVAEAFADIVADNLSANSIAFTQDATDDTKYTATVPSDGYYFIQDTTSSLTHVIDESSSESDTLSKYILKVVKDVEVAAKDTGIPVDKRITGQGTEKVKEGSSNIGDVIPYEVKTKVPDTTRFASYTFNMYDTLDAGLTYFDTLAVTMDGTALTLNTDYKVTVTNADDSAFTVPADAAAAVTTVGGQKIKIEFLTIKALGDVAANQGKDIVITYNVVLNEKATKGTTTNENEVYFEYSKNPNDETVKGETPKSVTKTYTTEINVLKVDSENKALEGAVFELSGTTYNFVVVNGEKFVPTDYTARTGETIDDSKSYWKLIDGAYSETDPSTLADDSQYVNPYVECYKVTMVNVVETTEGGTTNITVVSGADGKMSFTGLKPGKYTLTEIAAPDGFNKIVEPLTIEITWTAENGFDKTASSTAGWTKEADGTFAITVVNEEGTVLPSTGGIGTTMFYIFGGLLVMGASLVLITRRRMNA